ncbi:MAG TPA: hypothetical protein VNM45_17725 [Bacillus sp. (in: firmicutes)]|nr:hypothetical protein [Bacillus sp. (in: firmicutes)]
MNRLTGEGYADPKMVKDFEAYCWYSYQRFITTYFQEGNIQNIGYKFKKLLQTIYPALMGSETPASKLGVIGEA